MDQRTSQSGTRRPGRSWPQNLLLVARDARFIRAASEEWSAHWGGADGAALLDAAGLAPSALIGELRSVPMWQEHQVVRLRHAEAASPELLADLAGYLGHPAATTALLVEVEGELDFKRLPPAWAALVSSVEWRDLNPKGARSFIQDRARAEGYRVAPEAARALEEWASGDLGLLASALDLLFLYRIDERFVEAEDLDRLLGAGGTPRQWDLQDAFLEGRRDRFVSLLEGIRRDSAAAPLAFAGMLGKQMRSLLLLHGQLARGKRASDLSPKEVGQGHPLPVQKLLKVAPRWPEARVRSTLGALYELDLALKGEAGEAWSILERHLLHLI
jgi:DNA polymerase III delta subunit